MWGAGDGDEAEDAEDEREEKPADGGIVFLAGKPDGEDGADDRLHGNERNEYQKQFRRNGHNDLLGFIRIPV